jgi:hypothetical protein
MTDATSDPDRRISDEAVTDETRASEVLDAYRAHDAAGEPTPEEEAAADRSRADYDPKTGEAYREYLDLAVGQEGESRI